MATITVRQLEIFSQVVKHGSFRNCARQIGVSQVAISDHIRQLEQRLGHKLFERISGGASVLTPAGKRAYAHATHILAGMDKLIAEMAQADADHPPLPRKLVIAAHSFILRYFQDALAQFEEDMPEIGIELDLDTCSAGPLAEKMRKGTVDIGFFYALGAPSEPESDLVWHEPLALFVAKDHDLAQRPHVQPSDVIKYPVVRFSERNHLGLLINEAMEQAGLGDCTVATETDDYGLILSSVRKIHGCFCMLESSSADLRNVGGLQPIAFAGELPDIAVRRAVRAPWRNDPVVIKLLSTL